MNAFVALREHMVRSILRDFVDQQASKEQLDSPLLFQASATRPKRVLYITKPSMVRSLGIDHQHSTPKNVSVFARCGLVTPAYGALVGCEAVRSKADVHFVGDLDPWDWTVFLTLLIELRKCGVKVRYAGVNDAWIESCRLKGRKPIPFATWTIPLGRFEADLFQRLCELPVPWDRVAGRSAVRLLQDGFKLELEGATNPGIYKKSHHKTVREMVLGIE